MADNGYGKKPLWQWVLIYLVIAGIIYGGVYYFVLAKKGTMRPYTSVVPTSVSNATKIAVTGNEFAFTPSTVTGKVGEPMEIVFTNTGKYPHNLAIADLNVQTKTIQPGEKDSVVFTPTKAGSFEFVCTVPGHADRGMRGTLKVQ